MVRDEFIGKDQAVLVLLVGSWNVKPSEQRERPLLLHKSIRL
jgi:hypothetical protein